MHYKAGERESPESWTGNWRIESLKVGNKKTAKLGQTMNIFVILQDPQQVLILSTRNSQV